MTARTRDAANGLKPHELRLDRLLGRRVVGRNNESIGHIEELRAERHGNGCLVTEYVIGEAGLMERLGVGIRLLFGRRAGGGYVARWDQLDIRDPEHPRLTCSKNDLRKL